MKRSLAVPFVLVMLVLPVLPGLSIDTALAHCQVPCGIYDDGARLARLREDTQTIEKAIAKINALAGQADPQSVNQLARWIDAKDRHADNIIVIVSAYFLTQKIKPASPETEVVYGEYLTALRDHHVVMVMAMKCKQSADPGVTKLLEGAIDAMAQHYAN